MSLSKALANVFHQSQSIALPVGKQIQGAALTAETLQSAISNCANFSSIATDANGVVQNFNVGACHLLGYEKADLIKSLIPADISAPQDLMRDATAMSIQFGTTFIPGFEALGFKTARQMNFQIAV